MACFALTEAEAGSDVSRVQCTAVRQGQDYILTGTKKFVTSGQVASFGLVAASTAPELGAKGISAFIVDLENAAGVTIGPLQDKLGLKATGTVDLTFDQLRIPAENLLGQENQGLKVMLRALDDGRIGTAAQAVGLGRAILTESLAYARQRQQFGQPIAQFQTIQWKLADIATEVEAAELLTIKAAWRKDQGLPYDTAAAMAKLFATDAAMRAALEGVQILGGYGYLDSQVHERLYGEENPMTKKLTAGLVQVYTGDGKGKTTAALGLALRAVGRGFQVLMIQFLKGEESGERLAAPRLAPEFTIRHFGRCGFIRRAKPDAEDVAEAHAALALAQQSIKSGAYDLVILDEINIALYFKLLDVAEVLDLIKSRHPQVELVLTGRYAPPEIIAAADLVTEMKSLKHYYQDGVLAREGIES